MQFNEKTFCPYIIDKTTPIKKYLYCSKQDTLCKMVEYYPNGDMVPKRDVKTFGCPYGYAIQVIEKKNMKKDNVIENNNGLDDISIQKKTENKSKSATGRKKTTQNIANKQKNTTKNRKKTTKKKS